jgi:hypothetical protein
MQAQDTHCSSVMCFISYIWFAVLRSTADECIKFLGYTYIGKSNGFSYYY